MQNETMEMGKGEKGKGEYENARTKLEDMELIFQQG